MVINDDTVVQRFFFVIAFQHYLGGICKLYGWLISRVINIVASSAELGINTLELNGGF